MKKKPSHVAETRDNVDDPRYNVYYQFKFVVIKPGHFALHVTFTDDCCIGWSTTDR